MRILRTEGGAMRRTGLAAACAACLLANESGAQVRPAGGAPTASPGAPPAAANAPKAPDSVKIERVPLALLAPEATRVHLHLEPHKSIPLVVQSDTTVLRVPVAAGKAVPAQAEIVRPDVREHELLVERAKALLKAAQTEAAHAATRPEPGAKDLAEARLEAARIEVQLAELRLDRFAVRSPIAGRVDRLHVVEGQFVRAGTVVAVVSDSTKLVVEMPVDRKAVQVGGTLDVLVEETTVKGTVTDVRALPERFAGARDLLESAAAAVVLIDNAAGKLAAGQIVRSNLLPRDPVALVPNSALGNGAEGRRKVQVLRNNAVRDVVVELLAARGEDGTFVAGAFAPADELVVKSSVPLADGTVVAPLGTAGGTATAARPAATGVPGQSVPAGTTAAQRSGLFGDP